MTNEQQPKQQIQITDNIPGGEYANVMQIGHTPEEFTMIFMNVLGPSGKVVGKIIASPGHMKRIVAALQENIKKYEDNLGVIKTAADPQAPGVIGFEERK